MLQDRGPALPGSLTPGNGGARQQHTPAPDRDVFTMVLDAEGRLMFANGVLLKLGGWQWPCIGARAWYDVLVPPEARESVRGALARQFEVGAGGYLETPVRAADGSIHTVAWACSRSLDHRGRLQTITGVGIDVTLWVDERDRLAAQRQYDAEHDSLTGLYSADRFSALVDSSLADLRGKDGHLAVLLVNVDRFRAITETQGRQAGDRLLRAVALRIEKCAGGRPVCRWSGDEFAVLMSAISGPSEAVGVAQSIVDGMRGPCSVGAAQFYLGASVGIVIGPDDGDNASRLLGHASMAMRQARRAGGDRHSLFRASLSEEARERMVIEQQLHGALARGEIRVHYQPQVGAGTGDIVAVEALARWHHPLLGAIPPSHFIPLAEELGLVNAIGVHVLRVALSDAATWRASGLPAVRVAVNVSARQLADPDFRSTVEGILEETETPPQLLELEVTESAVMSDMEAGARVLRELAKLGISISLDDFGTGYSCISYLSYLQVGTIKIDRSFMGTSPLVADAHALVRGLVALARHLDLRVVAEGVETPEQLVRLIPEGVDVYQGFLFSRPVPDQEIRELLLTGLPVPSMGEAQRPGRKRR